ncbi:MAG: SDR family NAD(P)-dependent oxidoreductase [Flavobacteriales bacterium]|nr:SDR family NAD(P)-dependent oxidoreductase [Flavobacteriales bacterium]
MKSIIITGASKGLGNALALNYLSKGYSVYSISRTKADNLSEVTQIECDLSDLEGLKTAFTTLLNTMRATSPTSLMLINNAGSLGTVSHLENIDSDNIIQTVNLNYTAPLLLNSMFIKQTEDWKINRSIRTISSGAATSSIDGWSVYSSSKAAIDQMTKAMGVEQANKTNPVHTLSIYPGVVDTQMQGEIRNSKSEDFSNIEKFKDMKANNELASPESVAQLVYKIDKDSSLDNGSVVTVRDYS